MIVSTLLDKNTLIRQFGQARMHHTDNKNKIKDQRKKSITLFVRSELLLKKTVKGLARESLFNNAINGKAPIY